MMAGLVDRLDGKLNPIMVKEVYQGFRGRGFVIGCSLALLVCLGGYMTIVLPASPTQETLGQELFTVLSLSMAVIALIVIPMGAGSQLRTEITSQTMDLIAITNLSPWAIVSGRFQAALLKILLLFSYMGPFAIAAFLLGGIDVSFILTMLGVMFLNALILCALALMINALPALNPHYQLVARIGQALLLFFIAFQGIFLQLFTLSYGGRILPLVTGWDVGFWIAFYVLTAALFSSFLLRLGADMLTPVGIRTFAASKLILALTLAALSLPFAGSLLLPSWVPLTSDANYAVLFSMLSPLYFFALFWSSQADKPARRWADYVLGDGYTPTLIYTAMLTLGISALFNWSTTGNPVPLLGLVYFSHFLFFSGLARLFCRLLKPAKRTSIHYVTIAVGLWLLSFWIASISGVKFPSRTVGADLLLPFCIGAVAAGLGRQKSAGAVPAHG